MSGFSDPIHQIDYGDFYYEMGLIDSLQLKYFQSQESLAKSFIKSKNFYEAYEVRNWIRDLRKVVKRIRYNPKKIKNYSF